MITVGKFGATDIFDTNKYAHDTRSDFFNWSRLCKNSYIGEMWKIQFSNTVSSHMCTA